MQIYKLSQAQWKILISVMSNTSQAVILFGLAGYFVPQSINLTLDFPRKFAVLTLVAGLLILLATVILGKRGK
jgi:hypothetical protein